MYGQGEYGEGDEAGGPVERSAEVSHHLEEVWTTDPAGRRHGRASISPRRRLASTGLTLPRPLKEDHTIAEIVRLSFRHCG